MENLFILAVMLTYSNHNLNQIKCAYLQNEPSYLTYVNILN